MTIPETASLGCAVLSLVATILIGLLQIRQNRRVNIMAEKQRQTEQRRYEESVDIEARKFLSTYHDTIGLLPLCAIAVAYNKTRPYSRKMYADFRLLSDDVRRKIFEYCDWKMCDIDSSDFFADCLLKLELAIKQFLPKDIFSRMFYDHGKYVERAIKQYASKSLPHTDYKYNDSLSDVIRKPFQNGPYDKGVLDQVIDRFPFKNCPEQDTCQTACTTAKYIAFYSGQKIHDMDDETNYGAPGAWSGEEIETMEDLFLLTLFEIWSNIWDIEYF